MDLREPVTIRKNESSPQKIIREFCPYLGPSTSIGYAGRLIVRAENYGNRLSKFDELFAVMAADALQFEPPLQLDREDVEVVHYAGSMYKRTFGLEVNIPKGVIVSNKYTQVSQQESLL